MSDKIKIGKFGQSLAVQFLTKRNYQILTENYYCKEGEIDIVAKHGEQLVYVEVKTRLSRNFGLPEEAVDQLKKEKIEEAALKYIEEQQLNTDNWRIDCIAIEIDKIKQKVKIRHHKGIV